MSTWPHFVMSWFPLRLRPRGRGAGACLKVERLESRTLLSFRLPGPFPVGVSPFAVVAADLRQNGNVDLITANKSSNDVSVLLGTGHGGFTPDPFSSPGLPAGSFAVGSGPFALAVADFNGDGVPDIVTANFTGSNVSVLLGSGNGAFQNQETLHTDITPLSVAVADLTGDGKADIVTANYLSNDVSVLLGNGDGTFQPARNFAAGNGTKGVAIADVNGDGRPDIITVNAKDDNVGVLLANGDGSFSPGGSFPIGSVPKGLAVATLTGDGIPDVVTANYQGNDVSVLLGTGNGFAPVGIPRPVPAPEPLPSPILVPRPAPASMTLPIDTVSLALTNITPPALTSATTSSAPVGTTSFISFASLGLSPLTVTTSTIVAPGSGPMPPPAMGPAVETIQSLLEILAPQPERLELSTEKDILESMDIAASLGNRARPQANLIPQTHTVGAIGVLQSSDAGAPVGRTAEPAQPAEKKIDVRPYLISPLAQTPLGPTVPSANERLPPELPVGRLDAIESLLPFRKDDPDRPDSGRWSAGARLPDPWWKEVLLLSMAAVTVLASFAPPQEPRRNPDLPARR
jgi:hypothetical protein